MHGHVFVFVTAGVTMLLDLYRVNKVFFLKPKKPNITDSSMKPPPLTNSGQSRAVTPFYDKDPRAS